MGALPITSPVSSSPSFPALEVRRRLEAELSRIADENAVLRPEWEPLLDSQRVVGTVLAIEDLFPFMRIPPDKVVQRGGYSTVEEALKDMVERIERVVMNRSKRKEAE